MMTIRQELSTVREHYCQVSDEELRQQLIDFSVEVEGMSRDDMIDQLMAIEEYCAFR